MDLNPVTLSNRLRWDGHLMPFYESYDLWLNHLSQGWFLHVQFLVREEEIVGYKSMAQIHVVFSQKDEPLKKISQGFLLEDIDIFHREKFIQVGKSHLALDETSGYIEEGDQSFAWQIQFYDPLYSYDIFPKDNFLKFLFPSFGMNAPRGLCKIDGEFKLNGKTFLAHDCWASQRHYWTPKFPKRMLYAHAHDFENHNDTCVDVLTLERNFLGVKLPDINVLKITSPEHDIHLQRIGNYSNDQLLEWHVELPYKKERLHVRVRREMPLIYGVDPSFADQKISYDCLESQMEIDFLIKKNNGWQVRETWNSKPNVYFSCLSSQVDPRVSLIS